VVEAMSEERLKRLAQVSDRNRRLREVPFETHGPEVEHGSVCIPCQLVRAIDDVTWLLERLGEIGETREEWYIRWPVAGGGYTYELCEDEHDARNAIPDDDETCEIVKRMVGAERKVER